MRFEFATSNRVLFGEGVAGELIPIAESFGKRILIVSGARGERARTLAQELRVSGFEASQLQVSGEPTVEMVTAGVERARSADSELILAIGGGSAIDAGKAIAALTGNPGTIYDYLEVVGQGHTLTKPSLPCIAVPTTSGTGSEVTRNAVLRVPEQRVKVSLRGASILPKAAIVDPELTYGMPRAVTASTGCDALTQLIEPFLSSAANPMTDALCRAGIRLAAHSLLRACDEPDDRQARQDMSLAALFSGMALANSKLGAVHGLAGPIGGMFPAPHGAVCAALLPLVVQANHAALDKRAPESRALRRFDELGDLLCEGHGSGAEAGFKWLHRLRSDLGIAPLGTYGVSAENFPLVIAQARKSSSMRGNPVLLTDDELRGVLEAAV